MRRPRSRKGADGLGSADDVAAKLRALEQMDGPALRAEWRRFYRAHPPKGVRRDLLLLGVAWKVQEQAYGGFGLRATADGSIGSSHARRPNDLPRRDLHP